MVKRPVILNKIPNNAAKLATIIANLLFQQMAIPFLAHDIIHIGICSLKIYTFNKKDYFLPITMFIGAVYR